MRRFRTPSPTWTDPTRIARSRPGESDLLLQRRGVQRARGPEGPWERPTTQCRLETGGHGMQVGTPARQRTAKIGKACVPDQRHTQQIVLGRASPTAHARTFRAGPGGRPARHHRFYLLVCAAALPGHRRRLRGPGHSRAHTPGPAPARHDTGARGGQPSSGAGPTALAPARRPPTAPWGRGTAGGRPQGRRGSEPSSPGSVSGRMSIRHPVSLAARRAFCPSLPMARESW